MPSDPFEYLEEQHHKKRPCPGMSMSWIHDMGDMAPRVIIDQQKCPELQRREGHRPEGGKGYSERWNESCRTCDNTGKATAHLIPSEHLDCPFCHKSVWAEMTAEM